MVEECLKYYVPLLSQEDLLTIRQNPESRICEFCELPHREEVEVAIDGGRGIVLICGQCAASKEILKNTIIRHERCEAKEKQ